MARFWLHGNHLCVEGKKMSKSRGTVLYTDDLLTQGYTAAEIRFFLSYGHYREKLSYTEKAMESAAEKLRRLRGQVKKGAGRASRTRRGRMCTGDEGCVPQPHGSGPGGARCLRRRCPGGGVFSAGIDSAGRGSGCHRCPSRDRLGLQGHYVDASPLCVRISHSPFWASGGRLLPSEKIGAAPGMACPPCGRKWYQKIVDIQNGSSYRKPRKSEFFPATSIHYGEDSSQNTQDD
jgi:hypothetical protein